MGNVKLVYTVMESSNDVIITHPEHIESNASLGFKVVGSRKTEKGAQALAERRCLIGN
jgi:hypothetical protein